MTKIVVLALIMCGALFVGVSINNHYIKRKNFFNELNKFLGYLKIQVKFQKSRLKTLVDDYRVGVSGTDFGDFLGAFSGYLSNLNDESEFEVELPFLRQEEKSALIRIFTSIGRFNSEGESANLSSALAEANEYYNTAMESQKKFGAVSIKLSVAGGLFVILILM